MAREHQRHIQKEEPGSLPTSDKKKTKPWLEIEEMVVLPCPRKVATTTP